MQVFSPSATAKHSRCPMLWHLGNDWTNRVLGKREIAAFLGRGIGAGLGTYYSIVQATGSPCPDPEAPSEIAASIALQSLTDAKDAGATVPDYEADGAAALAGKARNAILQYAKWDKLGKAVPHAWKVLDVEETMPDHGWARIDLGVDDGEGPAVLDWKSKGYLKAEWLARELTRYENAGQFMHYSWAYASRFNRPYLPRYYVGLIVLSPTFKVVIEPYTITPEDHNVWLRSSRQQWADMDAEKRGDRLPSLSWEHADQFGDCEFKRACLLYHWDPALMTTTYYPKKKKEEST